MKNFIYRRILLLFFISFIFSSVCAHNKIIYFISPPRSLSVAFMRMMQARGDFLIMNEPSQYAFNLINSPETVNDWFNENAYKTFEEVKKNIFENAQHASIFVKEISFAVQDFLLNDSEFIKNPHVYFVFLIRNPHHAVISFYKKIQQNFEIFESDNAHYTFSDVIGYKSLYEIIYGIKQNSTKPITIILSEELYTNPEETVKKFCDDCHIPFIQDALTWQDLGDNFSGQSEWHELKKSDATQHWHNDAIRSNGFSKPSEYETDQNDNPTFSEIENLEHRNICIEAYKENLKYYNLILQFK